MPAVYVGPSYLMMVGQLMKSPTKTPLVGLTKVDSHEQVRYWQMHYRIPVWRLVLVGFSTYQAITACPVKCRRKISMQVQNEKEYRIIPTQRCGSLDPCSDATVQGGAAITFPSLTDFQVRGPRGSRALEPCIHTTLSGPRP